jgi:hypothetical protein
MGLLVAAWLVVVSTVTGQTLVSKQIRIEPRACHLPAVAGAWPLDGAWEPVTVSVKCARR